MKIHADHIMMRTALRSQSMLAAFVSVHHSLMPDYGERSHTTRAALVRHLMEVTGKGRSTAENWVHHYLKSYDIDGRTVRYARYGDSYEFVERVGIEAFREQLGCDVQRLIPVNPEDLTSPAKFKRAVYLGIVHLQNTFTLGGEVVSCKSRSGTHSITGLSEATQRRYERKLGITARPMYAVPVGADGDMYRQYGSYGSARRRRDIRSGAIQIRNLFVLPEQYADMTSMPLKPFTRRTDGHKASTDGHIDGEYAVRQLFVAGEYDIGTVMHIISRGVNVDVISGQDVDPRTGEIVYVCFRYSGNVDYEEGAVAAELCSGWDERIHHASMLKFAN
jgi:hypothetical protein